METYKIGETVLWSGAFGDHAEKEATILGIERCPEGEKYGDEVEEIGVHEHGTVTLNTGNWAYISQLRKKC